MKLRNAILFVSLFACADIPSQGKQAQLATHVQDWRDEVIYQLIVDRFADGDLNNDYTVFPGFLGKSLEGLAMSCGETGALLFDPALEVRGSRKIEAVEKGTCI